MWSQIDGKGKYLEGSYLLHVRIPLTVSISVQLSKDHPIRHSTHTIDGVGVWTTEAVEVIIIK